MELRDAIIGRRTIRRFADKPVSMELLTGMLADAAWAPNHRLREPWEFLIYDETTRDIFAGHVLGSIKPPPSEDGLKMLQARLSKNPCTIIVTIPNTPNHKILEEDLAAVSAFIQNLQLLAWEQKIGVVWKTDSYMYSMDFHDSLGLGLDKRIAAILNLGYFDEIPESKGRSDITSKITIVKRDA